MATVPTVGPRAFYLVLTEAINDIASHGFDTQSRIDMWTERIRQAATAAMIPDDQMHEMLRNSLHAVYNRLVEGGGILKSHGDVARFTLAKVKPRLRSELDRRVMASASLIKLNRQQMMARTLQRFTGWATSIPPGGSKATDKPEAKQNIRKALASLPFEQRRVMIDQGHKLAATLHEIVALDTGAIAGMWHSHWRQPNYDYREDHKERDELIYTVRGNWAMERGLMKAGDAGYYDAVTAVGEEPFCRCYMQWIYTLRRLPDEMLTVKGRESMKVRGAA